MPCEDELAYIESKPQHSAFDHDYWKEKAFFNLDDPDFSVSGEGRIDWQIEKLNGTKESPNKEYVMRSPVFNIAGYDWQIKFFPKGNRTEFLSVYIENLSVQCPNTSDFEVFDRLPFPLLEGEDLSWIKKRRSIAAQVGVVIYNPAEPRVYVHKEDACRFSKSSPDYGWRYFENLHREDFHLRRHGQRQALLRDDKLAFSAYIRIINDPTGCLWDSGENDAFETNIFKSSLRPFGGQLSTMVMMPLLHFSPFREIVKNLDVENKTIGNLQTLLWKMMTRTHSPRYGGRTSSTGPGDAATCLQLIWKQMRQVMEIARLEDMIGNLDTEDPGVAIHGNRLRTKHCASVQKAVKDHPVSLSTPALLVLELQRHEFDREKRKWNKLCHHVEVENEITVQGRRYHLFSFMTHIDSLLSNRHNSYVRAGDIWYCYGDCEVVVMTRKQAVEMHEGFRQPTADGTDLLQRHDSPVGSFSGRYDMAYDSEVIYLVMYVRDDHLPALSSQSRTESWDMSAAIRRGFVPKPLSKDKRKHANAIDETVQGGAESGNDQSPASGLLEATDAPTPDFVVMDEEGDILMSDAPDEPCVAFAENILQVNNGTDNSVQDREADDMIASTYIHELSEIPPEKIQPIVIDRLGCEYYSGGMMRGAYHGEGHLITLSGDEYIGSFVQGKRTGSGKMIYASNGNIYEGEWLDGEHHGRGKLIEASTGNVFEGGFKQGKKHGDFVLTGKFTEEDRAACTICFVNEMNTAFYDCGHVVACKECANKINDCPVCRRRVVSRLQLFGVKMVLE